MTAPTDAHLLHDLLDRAAARWPDAVAVTDDLGAVTFGELRRRSLRLAGWLHGRGVRRGDRVLVAMPADTLLPAVLYAVSRVGAVFAVVRTPAPDVALIHLLDDAEPVLVLTDDPDAGRLAAQRRVDHHGRTDLLAVLTATDPPEGTGTAPLTVDPVCLIYTSGSTGMPKAVVSTHAQVVYAATAIQGQLGYRPDDVVYTALPMSFDYGLYQLFLGALAGARVHLPSPDSAGRRLLACLRDSGATILPAVPSLAVNLVRLLRRPGAVAPPVRLLTNTGAAMAPEILAALRQRIPGLRVQLMFGLTECKRATIMPPDEDLHRPGACGLALPGTEIFAADDTGRRLPADTVGELVVRGPHVMAGYWRRPELTAQRFRRRDGLFPQLHTGDYGRIDADGYLHFEGRRDDLYKERGIRVSATEVEAASHRVPGVEAAGVLPPTDGHGGATLVVVGPLAPAEVLTGLRAQLEESKLPTRCLVVPSLPLNGNGKVDRRRLARLVAGEDHG